MKSKKLYIWFVVGIASFMAASFDVVMLIQMVLNPNTDYNGAIYSTIVRAALEIGLLVISIIKVRKIKRGN